MASEDRVRAVCRDCEWTGVAHRTQRGAEHDGSDHAAEQPDHTIEYEETDDHGDDPGHGGVRGMQ